MGKVTMFNLRRLLTFWGRVLLVAGSIPGVLFVLSVITELRAYQVSPVDVWPLCLLFDPFCSPAYWDFWPSVLLNMVPGLVAVIVVFWLAASFVRSLYGLKSTKEGGSFLVYRLIGRPKFSPFLLVKEGTIREDEEHALRRIGGPCGLLIYNDSAAITEKNGKLEHVFGPGVYQLDPFEKVWDVIDLRPQRWEFAVNAMTQEGIPVTCHADISFKIDDEGNQSTREKPYPMTEKAVFKAATSKWIREAGRTEPDRLMTWTKMVIIGETEGTLRSILARYPLDQLVEPDRRRAIRQELEDALRDSVPNLGAKILRVALGDIKLKDEVTQQWIEKWQAEGRRRMMELEARGQAARISIEANARIQAQVKMIANTARAFASMAKYGEEIPSRFVILRFIEMIKRTSVELLGKMYLPYDVMRTFKMLEGRIEGRTEEGAGDGDE
jgi:regulator of protease activity HflC (stomatin/prohibitin superfamily)